MWTPQTGAVQHLSSLQCRTRDAAAPALYGPRHNKQRYCACSKSMELGDRLLTTDISPLPSSLEVDIGLRNGPQSMLMFRLLKVGDLSRCHHETSAPQIPGSGRGRCRAA